MRLLWHSNWTRGQTGYGKQTRLVATRLERAGHEVIVSATFGVGGPVEIDGLLHVPGLLGSLKDPRLLAMHIRHFRPDAVVSLVDVWPLDARFGAAIREAGSAWVPWVPVDHDPCPPALPVRLSHADAIVAMSRFGQLRLEEAGLQATLIPHGVDLSVFKPGDRARAREELGLPPDVFLVTMVQANKGYPSRKCFQQQFEGFARFHARHPESALYLHSIEGTEHGGPNLGSVARALGMRDAVICLEPYQALMGLPDRAMARLYQAADVTLNATGGEGFGVPIIESLACGTPVIVTDFTSMTELCPDGVGWRVGWTDRFFTAIESWQVWPDPAQIDQALEAAYAAERDAMREACVEHGRRFDADRVAGMWAGLLEERFTEAGRPAAETDASARRAAGD